MKAAELITRWQDKGDLHPRMLTIDIHLHLRCIITPAIDMPQAELDRPPSIISLAILHDIKPLVEQNLFQL